MIYKKKKTLENLWLATAENLCLHALFFPHPSPGKSFPIVLVSGLGVSSSYMIPAALELAKNAEIYCPDLPGFGKSSQPARTLNIPELSNALSAFMEETKIERAILIGHSFGCQILAEFALQSPEKIERLIFAAPTGEGDLIIGLRYLGRLLVDAVREPFSLIPLAVKDYLSAGLLRVLNTYRIALGDQFENKLCRIKAPTLVVRGSKDPIVSHIWARKVAKMLPEGRLVSIEGAAHAVNYSSPDKFARVIEEFIERDSLKRDDKIEA